MSAVSAGKMINAVSKVITEFKFILMLITSNHICQGQIHLVTTSVPFTNENWNLKCILDHQINSTVIIAQPSGLNVGSCTPTDPFVPAYCSSNTGYTFAINESTNTVSLSKTLSSTDTGVWRCQLQSHYSATYNLTNTIDRSYPQGETAYSKHNMSANAGAEIYGDTGDSFTFDYGCLSEAVMFKWEIVHSDSEVPVTISTDTADTISTTLTCNTYNAYQSRQFTGNIVSLVRKVNTSLKVLVYADNYYDLPPLEEYTFDINFFPVVSTSDCEYFVCIIIFLVLVVFYDGVITLCLVVKVDREDPETPLLNVSSETTENNVFKPKVCTVDISKRFAASMGILFACSAIVFITGIIVSLHWDLCSCDEFAAISLSTIPAASSLFLSSIIVWINLICFGRPEKANIIRAFVVATLGIYIGIKIIIQFVRNRPSSVTPSSNLIVTFLSKAKPRKYLITWELINPESEKIKGYKIHYKRLTDLKYTKTGLIRPQINSFELDSIMEDNGVYELFVNEVDTGWKSETLTCNPSEDYKETRSVELLKKITLLENIHIKHMKEVSWTHDGKPINVENSCIYKGGVTSDPALTVLYASNKDSGEYICSVTSTNEEKTIIEKKEFISYLTVNDYNKTKSVAMMEDITLLEKLHRISNIKKVNWTHEGLPIHLGHCSMYKGGDMSHPALTVLNTSKTDSGKYVCTITFQNEKDTAQETKEFSIRLTVDDETKSVVMLEDITLLEKLHSKSNMKKVSWTHDGKPIHLENSSLYKGGDKNHPALTILYASKTDSGEYVCTVTFKNENETGNETKEFNVRLIVNDTNEAKSINMLNECTLLENFHSNAHLKDVNWTHDGQQICTANSCIYKGGDTAHPALILLYASNNDSGEYVCTATFINEKETTIEAKKFTVHLTVCDKNEAKYVELLKECILLENLHSNKHIREVYWTHDGKPIPTDNHSIYKGGNTSNPALTVLYASKTDSGEYVCTVKFTNEKKQVEETKKFNVCLTVSGSLEVSVDAGKDIQLLTQLKTITNLKAVDWEHDGNPANSQNSCLYNGGNKEMPPLTVLYVSKIDSGKYVCKLYFESDKTNPVFTKTFDIQLNVQTNAVREIKKEKKITLLKSLKRNPKDEHIKLVEWFHQSQPIIINNDYYIGGDTSDPSLTILSASLNDSGEYFCTITFNRKTPEQRTDKKTFAANLRVNEKNTSKPRALPSLKTETIQN